LIALLVIAGTVLVLGSAFFRTQVVRTDDFVLRAEDNRIRAIAVPAPRGTIFDRNGEVVARTVTTYALSMQPTSSDTALAGLLRLQPVLGLGDGEVEGLATRVGNSWREPVRVAGSLTFEQRSWIEEHRTELPELILEAAPRREYPDGAAVAHLIGYVAEISRAELDDSLRWSGYRMGQHVGKAGIERQYEGTLGGRLGESYVEVDARGRIVGPIASRSALEAIPGDDIHLTLDLGLQRFIRSIFPEHLNGAVVAMVPSTGEVLALYSHPSFDPNALVGGADPVLWDAINRDPRRPLLNRATAGIYPPGSTWKLATAIVGLEAGVIEPASRMPIACTGGMSYAGRYARCWRREGHGLLGLADAIAHSCNVYFYQLGIWLGLNQLTREGTRLGFSRPTGIDLPAEHSGTFPSGGDWYRERFGWPPTPSEVMSLSIGQGPNSQTPLRMAQFFSALAGDGTAPAPRLLAGPRPDAAPETDLKLRPPTLVAVREGLARTLEPGGTAYMSSLARWKVYGKTGTSQNSENPDRPHAWFTGFAGPPDADPEIAIAVLVELGESGSAMAAPIAAKAADFYLNREHDLETDPLQTLRERTTLVPF
jgi:penicillin-binding protein 2